MRLTILVALVTLTASRRQVVAQSRFEVVPSVSVTGVYDDNLFAEVEGSAGKMLQFRPNFEDQLRIAAAAVSQPLFAGHAALEFRDAQQRRCQTSRLPRDHVPQVAADHLRRRGAIRPIGNAR